MTYITLYVRYLAEAAELRSAGQPRAAVPTWGFSFVRLDGYFTAVSSATAVLK
jgi:hypothetical protein